MQFFNFENNQTYHFFVWLSESGYIDTERLITKAWEAVKDNESFKKGADGFSVAKNILAGELAEILVRLTADLGATHYHIGEVECGTPLEMLSRPLLAHAMYEIQFFSVAEALLIQAGKRAPGETVPEFV
jgi:hypothetical protein